MNLPPCNVSHMALLCMTKKQNLLAFVRPRTATWCRFDGTSPQQSTPFRAPRHSCFPPQTPRSALRTRCLFLRLQTSCPWFAYGIFLTLISKPTFFLCQASCQDRQAELREVLKEVKYSRKGPAALEDIIMQPRREAESWRLVQTLLQGVLSTQPWERSKESSEQGLPEEVGVRKEGGSGGGDLCSWPATGENSHRESHLASTGSAKAEASRCGEG